MNLLPALHTWWRARVPRERTMLLLMFAALAAFAYWYALLQPLRHLRDQARTSHALAASELAVVAADAATIDALRRQHAPAPGPEAFAPGILAGARQAGVAIARHRTGADGTLEVGIDAIDAPVLLSWLDALGADAGIAPLRMTVEKADGRLRVEAAFAHGQAAP